MKKKEEDRKTPIGNGGLFCEFGEVVRGQGKKKGEGERRKDEGERIKIRREYLKEEGGRRKDKKIGGLVS